MTAPNSESLPTEPSAADESPAPADSQGRGLNLRGGVLLLIGLLLGGVVSRVVNVGLDRRRAEQEYQRHLARVERDRSQHQWAALEAQMAAKRAKRGLPQVDPAPGEAQAAPVQAN